MKEHRYLPGAAKTGRPPPDPSGYRRSAFAHIGVFFLMALILTLIYFTVHLLILTFIGILLAIFLRGLGRWLNVHTRIPMAVSILVVVLGLGGLMALAGYISGPRLLDQINQLIEKVPDMVQYLQDFLQNNPWTSWLVERLPNWDRNFLTPALKQTGALFTTTLYGFGDLIVVLFIALYLTAAPRPYLDGIVKMVPPENRGQAGRILDVLGNTLWRWLIGRLLGMLIIGTCTGIGLWLLGIPLAFMLAVLAALLTFIPYIGPAIAIIPPMLLALMDSPMQALWVFVLYLGIQTLESYIVTPMIALEAVTIPPVLVLVMQIAMGILVGLIGVMIATPFTAVILVLIRMLYVQGILGDCFDGGHSGRQPLSEKCAPEKPPPGE